MDKRGRTLVPSTQTADKEPEPRQSEENDEDESLLYSQGRRLQEQRMSWKRKLLIAVLIVGSMVCCFAGGFLVRDLGQPRLWNFDSYETRKQQPSQGPSPN